MATPKYKKAFEEMLADNQELFTEFQQLAAKAKLNPQKHGEAFKELKQKVLRVIRKNEDRLCAKSENTKFGVFSQTLADKFWEEIRIALPEVDFSVD